DTWRRLGVAAIGKPRLHQELPGPQCIDVILTVAAFGSGADIDIAAAEIVHHRRGDRLAVVIADERAVGPWIHEAKELRRARPRIEVGHIANHYAALTIESRTTGYSGSG